jgi:hypothetical protein
MPESNKLFIGIPNTGLLRTELVIWLMGQEADIYMPQLKPHDHCRNDIVLKFLDTQCEWLLMVDSDIVPPMDVADMMGNDVDVCAALANTIHNGELIPVGMTKNETGYYHDFKHSIPGLHRVDAVGTGCILIKRKVFDTLDRPFFRFKYDQNGLLLNGEDFDFSERVGEVYFDSNYKCKHYTTMAI